MINKLHYIAGNNELECSYRTFSSQKNNSFKYTGRIPAPLNENLEG